MPPKTKFTKDRIIEAAFEIARSEGLAAITIRKIAGRLGSSIAPVYVNFDDVEAVRRAVVRKVAAIGRGLLEEQDSGRPFFDLGVASIRLARHHPVLFLDLALTPNPYTDLIEEEMGPVGAAALESDPDLGGLPAAEREQLLLNMKVFQVGLSAMAANGRLPSDLPEEEVVGMMAAAADDFITMARRRAGRGD